MTREEFIIGCILMDQIGATCFAKRCFTNCDSHHFDMIKNNDIHTSEQKNCVTACLQIISGSVMSLELMIKHQQANLTCTEFPSYPRKILANLAMRGHLHCVGTTALSKKPDPGLQTSSRTSSALEANQFGSRGVPVCEPVRLQRQTSLALETNQFSSNVQFGN